MHRVSTNQSPLTLASLRRSTLAIGNDGSQRAARRVGYVAQFLPAPSERRRDRHRLAAAVDGERHVRARLQRGDDRPDVAGGADALTVDLEDDVADVEARIRRA